MVKFIGTTHGVGRARSPVYLPNVREDGDGCVNFCPNSDLPMCTHLTRLREIGQVDRRGLVRGALHLSRPMLDDGADNSIVHTAAAETTV